MNQTQRKRHTIGMFIHQIEGKYSEAMVRGIQDLAKEKDFNIIFFVGRALKSPYFDDIHHNVIYELARNDMVDGLIIPSGVIGNHIPKDELASFIRHFQPIPMVNISRPMQGIPSVLVNNKAGMKSLLKHLIELHGYRKILFIRGPVTNPEAEDRYKAYLEALEENQIPFNPKLVIQGDFSFEPNQELIRILDDKLIGFEAIVASNDNMGESALHELVKRGIRVPEDVAVTGYDNEERVQNTMPPFTTVEQMPYYQSRQAGMMLLDIIEGKNVEEDVSILPGVIVRKSCGCNNNYENNPDIDKLQKPLSSNQDLRELFLELNRNKKEISKIIRENIASSSIEGGQLRNLIEELVNALIEDIKNYPDARHFENAAVSYYQSRTNAKEESMESLWNCISVIRVLFFSNYTNELVKLYLEAIFQKTRIALNDIIFQLRISHVNELNLRLLNLRMMNQEINSSLSWDTVKSILSNRLPGIGIEECYISLYQDSSVDLSGKFPVLPEYSKLVLVYQRGGEINLERKETRFLTRQLLPNWIKLNAEQRTLIVKPLFNRNEHYGFMFLKMGRMEESIHAVLREQISSSLNYINLFKEREEAEISLKETMKKLRESEERFREMVTLLPMVVAETAVDLQLRFLNNSGLNAFGFAPEDLQLGVSILELVHPDDRERVRSYCAKILQGETPNFNEFRLLKRDGSKINLLSKAIPIYKNNRVDGIRWSAIDIRPIFTDAVLPDESFYIKYNLSSRERDVFKLWVQGHTIKEIAAKLFVVESTVKAHIGSIYALLDVKNKEEFFNFLKDYQTFAFGKESFLFSLLSKLLKE